MRKTVSKAKASARSLATWPVEESTEDDLAPPGYWDDCDDEFEPVIAALELRSLVLEFVAKWPPDQPFEEVIMTLSSALERARQLEAKRRSAKS